MCDESYRDMFHAEPMTIRKSLIEFVIADASD
jgi:hypothetical protein